MPVVRLIAACGMAPWHREARRSFEARERELAPDDTAPPKIRESLVPADWTGRITRLNADGTVREPPA